MRSSNSMTLLVLLVGLSVPVTAKAQGCGMLCGGGFDGLGRIILIAGGTLAAADLGLTGYAGWTLLAKRNRYRGMGVLEILFMGPQAVAAGVLTFMHFNNRFEPLRIVGAAVTLWFSAMVFHGVWLLTRDEDDAPRWARHEAEPWDEEATGPRLQVGPTLVVAGGATGPGLAVSLRF